MAQSYCNLLYHLVFGTKNHRPYLDSPDAQRVHEYLGGAIRNLGGISLGINGTADHVHILAKLRQDRAVSDVLRDIKAGSSGWIHGAFPRMADFAWQDGYGAFTVSQSQAGRLKKYIAGQVDHHRTVSFKEEFIALLRAHGVEYDERYIWG